MPASARATKKKELFVTANRQLVELTADIVSAYVDNASIPMAELPALIQQVHKALSAAASGETVVASGPLIPAVSIKNSITADYLICLEDGMKFRSMKRHLRNAYDLSPVEYRAKWGLPKDYPMVAPSYAAARSDLAKRMGLGRGPRNVVAAPVKAVARRKAK
jgi:predicted transcriptional regulator